METASSYGNQQRLLQLAERTDFLTGKVMASKRANFSFSSAGVRMKSHSGKYKVKVPDQKMNLEPRELV